VQTLAKKSYDESSLEYMLGFPSHQHYHPLKTSKMLQEHGLFHCSFRSILVQKKCFELMEEGEFEDVSRIFHQTVVLLILHVISKTPRKK